MLAVVNGKQWEFKFLPKSTINPLSFYGGDVRCAVDFFMLELTILGTLLLCTSSLQLVSYRVVEIRCFSETSLSGMEG